MQVTIKDIVDFYDQNPDCIGKLFANSRHGFKRIEWADVTLRDGVSCELVTNTGRSVVASLDHKFFSDGEWKKVKNFNISDNIDVIDGTEQIKSITVLDDVVDLYDLQIEDVKEFYANGFVSHNSTLLEALLFSLYGRPYRNINKPQLVNSITQKNCLVEVEFSVRGKNYLVRRGIKPAIFEIHCDGKLVDELSNVREYQEYLEKNILQLNHKSFTQIVVIGSANFTPFMQLRTHERREIIEDLLDIEIFSKMYSVLKEKIQSNRESISELKYQIDLLKQKIDLTKKHMNELRSLKQQDVEKNRAEIQSLKQEIQTAQDDIRQYNERINELQSKIYDRDKLKSKLRKLELLDDQLKNRVNSINNEIKFFIDNDSCPTCQQSIDDDFRQRNIDERKTKQEEIHDGLSKISNDCSELSIKLDNYMQIATQIAELQTESLSRSSLITHHEATIRKLNETVEKAEVIDDHAALEELDSLCVSEREYRNQLNNLLKRQNNYDVVSTLLKDSGIKSRIIRQYIPIINKLMNKYLAIMDFFVKFELDENFNESIKSRFHDDFTYNSFSEGEKFRLDIALLFTWRNVAKLRNSISTNLLVMDEVFDSSLDSNGTDEFLKMLIELSEDTNVFVISHKGAALYDKFHSNIHFEKVKNFSKIARV